MNWKERETGTGDLPAQSHHHVQQLFKETWMNYI